MSECPVCAADVEVAKDAITGELLICDDCGAELELMQTDPAILSEAPTAEEDWGQ